jgi:sugar lactone lactonase YvrE
MKPTLLIDNLAFPESLRWHNDRLYVSDWGAQELLTLDQKNNREVVAEVRAFPFCTAFLPNGKLLVVTKNTLSSIKTDGSLELYADLSVVSDKGWNEIVADARGNVYVNGGSDGFAGEPGFIILVTPDGSVKQVADGLAFPNGMAITPDNKTLIVAESYSKILTAYDIASDGTLSNRRVWAETGEFGPDGICIDAESAVWCASGQRCLRLCEGGEVLQEVSLELFCTACMLGGSDKKTLYMTVVHWGGEETMAEIGKIAASLETGQPVKWSGKRTGQLLSIPAPATGVGYP